MTNCPIHFWENDHITDLQIPPRNRSSLVKQDISDTTDALQRFAGLEQDSIFCTTSHPHHDGQGCCQTHRTRARDDQDRDHPKHCLSCITDHNEPDAKGDNGDCQHDGNKDCRNFVSQLLNGCFGRLSFFDLQDDLSQRRFTSYFGGSCD